MRFDRVYSSACILVGLASFGCSGNPDHSPNQRAEAYELTGRIQANSTARDVALSDEQRTRIYQRVEKDTLWHAENTTLLIGAAYRNEVEKRLLMERVPTWFASQSLDTRCMAFKMVYFLKEKGFAPEATKLASDLRALPSKDVMQEGIIGDIESYLQTQ